MGPSMSELTQNAEIQHASLENHAVSLICGLVVTCKLELLGIILLFS